MSGPLNDPATGTSTGAGVHRVRRSFRKVSIIAAGTALTVLVTWAVTWVIHTVERMASEDNPVSWSVETNPNRVAAFADLPIDVMLPPGVRPSSGPGPGCANFHDWARSQGAMDAGTTRLQVVLQGRSDGQVLVSDARAVIVGEQPAGVMLRCPTAGEAALRLLTIDLDSQLPVAQYTSEARRTFGFTLEKGETETFLITARAARSGCRWYLQLTLVTGARTRTIRVDDHGRPFGTVGTAGGPDWSWDGDSWLGPNNERVPVGGDLDRRRS